MNIFRRGFVLTLHFRHGTKHKIRCHAYDVRWSSETDEITYLSVDGRLPAYFRLADIVLIAARRRWI